MNINKTDESKIWNKLQKPSTLPNGFLLQEKTQHQGVWGKQIPGKDALNLKKKEKCYKPKAMSLKGRK